MPARSARMTPRAPSEARWNATEAPIAPAPATTIRATRPAPASRGRSAAARGLERPRAPALRASPPPQQALVGARELKPVGPAAYPPTPREGPEPRGKPRREPRDRPRGAL